MTARWFTLLRVSDDGVACMFTSLRAFLLHLHPDFYLTEIHHGAN